MKPWPIAFNLSSAAVCVWLASCCTAIGQETSSHEPALPPFADVSAVVQQQLAAKDDYRSGDLITQADFDKIDAAIARLGWDIADRDELRKRLLASDSFLAGQAGTRQGRAFLRRVSRIPDGYDRVEHLSKLSDGQRIIRRLVAGPDGQKLIDYLATAPGGTEMGRMLSHAPGGRNFNKPTGRIYTADQLIAALAESYASAETLGSR